MDLQGLAALLDNVNVFIIVVEQVTNRMLYVNKQFFLLQNFPERDYSQDTIYSFFASFHVEFDTDFIDAFRNMSVPEKEVFFCPLKKWFRIRKAPLVWNGKNADAIYFSDITEQRKSEELFHETELAYDLTSRKLNVLVWEYDKKTHTNILLKDPEDRLSIVPGYPKIIEDVPYSLVQTIDERYVDDFINLYTEVDRGKKFSEADVMLRPRNDGVDERFEHMSLTAFTNYLGEEKVLGIGIDITNRKREEEKYHRLNRQLSDVMDVAKESALLDLGRNQVLEHHCDDEDLLKKHESTSADGFIYAIGMDIGDTKIQGEFFDKFNVEQMRVAFVQGAQQITQDFPTSGRGIKRRWIRLTVNLSRNPESNSIEALTYLTDITQEKKREMIVSRLASGSFRYIAILYLDSDEIEFFTISHKLYHAMNGKGFEVYSKDREFRIQQGWIDKNDEEMYLEKTSLKTVRNELNEHNIYSCSFSQREDGKEYRLQLLYNWLDKKNGSVLLFCNDVTSSYQTEQRYLQEMRRALMEAEQAANSKMDFISRISHDIRTPLSAITSMTNFAFEDIDDREKLRSDLEKVSSSNHFLMSLINDVLDVSKIDSGRIELVPEVLTSKEFFNDIKNVFVPLCEQKGVAFETMQDLEADAILVDKVRFNQIFLNIISNAYKYTPAGGTVQFSVEGRMIPDGEEQLLRLTVRDNGIGMGEEFQKKMFVPFTQDLANPERQKLKTGTGLGMYIVKKLVTLMNGTILVDSAIGKGTTMTVTIPVPVVKEADISKEVPIALRKKLSGRVLLAEDNEINQEIALRTLNGMGLDADVAENGAIAVQMFEETPPGTYIAILMDIQMPVLTGYEAAEAIRLLERSDAKTIPIIALTANAFSEAVKHSREAGMNGHITKPINPDLLYRKLLEIEEDIAMR